MDAIFRNSGEMIEYTPSSDVDAGDVIVQGNIIGVALRDIEANTLGALQIKGNFDLVKSSTGSVVFAAGANVYWNTSTETAVAAPGSNVVLFGQAVLEAVATDSTVKVKLLQARGLAEGDQAAVVAATQDALTDNLGGSADTTLAAVTAAAAITDSSGGVDPGNNTIASITNSANAGSADVAPVAAAIAQLAAKLNTTSTAVGVLKDNEKDIAAQLAKIKVDIAAILTSLKNAGVMASA